jgi:phytoene dehydrogenase-like protein
VAGPAQALKQRVDVSSAEAWRRARIPDEIVDAVLRPFFSGVVLETAMTTSRRFTDLMVRMFVRGRSTVPAGGMQRLPEQIAASLPPGTVRLSTRVHEVGTAKVRTDAGEVSARAVVVATDPWTAAELLPVLEPAPRPHGVATVYHAAPAFPEASGMLLLDADRSPVSNSIALSEAAPEYAPAGRVLVATSMVHGPGLPDPDGPEVRSVLHRAAPRGPSYTTCSAAESCSGDDEGPARGDPGPALSRWISA